MTFADDDVISIKGGDKDFDGEAMSRKEEKLLKE